MSRESPVISTASNLITSWLKLVLGLATGIIVTRALGPDLKGEYASLRLILTLYVPFMLFGYTGGVLYYGVKSFIDLREFFWTGFLLVLVLVIVLTPTLYFLVSNGWLGRIAADTDPSAVILSLSFAPIILLNVYCESVLRAFHMFHAANLRTIIGAVATLLYCILAFFFLGIDLFQAVLGFAVGQIAQLCMSVWFTVKNVRVHWRLQFRKLLKPWSYGIKDWFNRIIAQSNDRFDQIILTFLLPAGSFGIYSVGVGLSNLITQVPSSYVNVFFNQIAERGQEEAIRLYAKAQRILFAITALLALAMVLVAYPLILLLYGYEFTQAAWVVAFYAPGIVFQVAARVSIKLYSAMGRPLKNSLVYLTGFLVSLPFYFLLIPRYGINGAAISSSIAYLSAFIFSFYQIKKEFGVRAIEVIGVRREDWLYITSQVSKLPVIGQRFTG